MPDYPIPTTYRADVVERLIKLIQTGESCSIVGVGSSGKSNLARYLTRADVQLKYFEREASQTFVLYLNCKPFALRRPSDLYLHILDELAQVAQGLDGDFASILLPLRELSHNAQMAAETLAKPNLDKAIREIFSTGARKMVLVLDDCDDLLKQAPPYLFSDLRSIRDNHKPMIVFITTTRRELVYLRENTPEYEEFFELFSAPGHTLPLPLYSREDALGMLSRLAARESPPRALSDSEVNRIYDLSGGHAGLLRSIFFATERGINLAAPDVVDRIAVKGDVESECQKIWTSLESEEQNFLITLVKNQPLPAEALYRLEQRGMVRLRFSLYPEPTSPVFFKFLANLLALPVVEQPAIRFTGVDYQVVVYGQLITNLNRAEYETLHTLANNRPNLCELGTLIEVIRAAELADGQKTHGSPPRRLEQYIQELKAKLGPAGVLIQSSGNSYRMLV